MATLGGASAEMEGRLSSAEEGSLATSEDRSESVSSLALHGATGIKAFQPFSHSHFFSDANLVALVFVLSLFWVLLGQAPAPAWIFPSRPSLRLLPAAARGPPRVF